MPRILITGALGQIGTELVPHLRKKYGTDNVVATDIREPSYEFAPFELLDVTDFGAFENVVKENNIDWIVHNASILSAKGEENPDLAMNVNIRSIEHALNLARKYKLRIFSPSSIAAFGPSTPKDDTPNTTCMRPNTIYGVSKVYGELLGEYYNFKFGVDYRSLRYPGIISSEALPGGGTTDYAVEIFYEALNNGHYTSFLKKDTALPMMYMPDTLKGTMQIIEAPSDQLTERVYNITALSFTPEDLAIAIQKQIPEFKIDYKPDFRQKIADTWPRSIDDREAREDWGWSPDFDIDSMTVDMLTKLREKLNPETN